MYDFPPNPEMRDALDQVNIAVLFGRLSDAEMFRAPLTFPYIRKVLHAECARRDALEA